MLHLECGTADLFVDSTTHTSVESHEFRVNAPINDTMSMTAGVFMSDTELLELNLFTYPGSTANDITYAANYALTDILLLEIYQIVESQRQSWCRLVFSWTFLRTSNIL